MPPTARRRTSAVPSPPSIRCSSPADFRPQTGNPPYRPYGRVRAVAGIEPAGAGSSSDSLTHRDEGDSPAHPRGCPGVGDVTSNGVTSNGDVSRSALRRVAGDARYVLVPSSSVFVGPVTRSASCGSRLTAPQRRIPPVPCPRAAQSRDTWLRRFDLNPDPRRARGIRRDGKHSRVRSADGVWPGRSNGAAGALPPSS